MTRTAYTKMVSTRVEEENITAIDRVARSQGISRSDWVRRAILAQLVLDLVDMKPQVTAKIVEEPKQEESAILIPFHQIRQAPLTVPAPEPEPSPYIEELAPTREHHTECIKSYDHEGECL
jgi:hypothetical protein